MTKSLKFDLAKKKMPTKLKKSSQDSSRKDKMTKFGRTIHTPNKSLKARSVVSDVDEKLEVQNISMEENSEVHTPRQKWKVGSDIQGSLSIVANKQAIKDKDNKLFENSI